MKKTGRASPHTGNNNPADYNSNS